MQKTYTGATFFELTVYKLPKSSLTNADILSGLVMFQPPQLYTVTDPGLEHLQPGRTITTIVLNACLSVTGRPRISGGCSKSLEFSALSCQGHAFLARLLPGTQDCTV